MKETVTIEERIERLERLINKIGTSIRHYQNNLNELYLKKAGFEEVSKEEMKDKLEFMPF